MKEAKARLEGVDASWKDLCAVADLIRYKPAQRAVDLLEKASRGEIFVPYRRHNKKMGHRKHGIKGRYPMKEAKLMLKLLKSALANARILGLDESKLKVKHVAANKKQIFYRIQPKGRPMRQRYVTARAEIILGEVNGS